MANQVDFKILPSDQFNVYSPQTRSEKVITYFTLLSKLRGDILAVSSQDDPNSIVSAYYTNVGNTQTLHLVKADGSEVTASNSFAGTVTSVGVSMPSAFTVTNSPITTSGTIQITGAGTTAQYVRGDGTLATFPSLTGFVPYVGATQNVDLGEYQIKAGQVAFDLTPTGTAGVGIMRWNSTDGTVDLGLMGGNVTLQVGQEQVVRVVNKSGINLTEAGYQAVKITGAQGNRLKVGLAQANNDANSADTIGLVTENIALNAEGFVTSSGLVRNIDTTGVLQGETWADGDVIYLSPTTPGAVTKVKPTAPQHTVILGFVVRAHQTQGQIYVKVDNGYELEELHDVAPTPYVNNGVLYRDTATNLWKSATIPTVLGYTPANSTTTISTTAPLSGGGDLSANRTLSISQAGASTDGYLSSIDWNTFNNKASDAFKTIAVTGQSNIVADSPTDTLTFEAGSNIVITTDAANDKITINAIGGGSGSVTSVDMSVPTGFSISGNPITTSGTLALAFASGYSLPTNASQANWDTAYNNSITAFSYNTSTGVLTLTQQDAGTLTATVTLQPFTTDNLTQGSTNLYDKVVSLTGAGTTVVTGTYPNFTITSNDQHVGTVTSIATSAPITGGTITTSGTIGITQSGASADGYLSSTDWNTFNSKVGGSGTINYVSKWTSTGAIGNSQIFDSGTYVGINTATPAAKLDISGAHVASIGLLRLNSSASNIAAQTYYINGVYKAATYAGTDDNFYILGRDADIVFSTTSSTTTRMVITNGGNVGIGTSGPTQKLMVSGSIRVTGGYYDSSNSIGSNGQVLASTGSGTTWINASGGTVNGSGTVNYLSKWTGTTLLGDSQLFDNGTNVGIGTATPAAKLDVSGNVRAAAALISQGGNNSWTGAAIFMDWQSTYGRIGAYNYATNAWMPISLNDNSIYITGANGNVGLGTTAPGVKLEVAGGIRATTSSGQIDVDPTSGAFRFYDGTTFRGGLGTGGWASVGATADIVQYLNGVNYYISNGSTALVKVEPTGKVGIGTTSPSTKLSVSGSDDVASTGVIEIITSGGTNLKIGGNTTYSWIQSHNSSPLYINQLGNNLILNLGGGNVGIGTASPGYKLDVSAAARVYGVRIGRDFSIANRATVRLDSNGDAPADILFGQTAAANQADWTGVYWSISSRNSGAGAAEGNKFTIWRGDAHSAPNNSESQFITITPGLNLGIGETSPTQKLHVSGNVRVTGAYYDSSNAAGTSGQILSSTGTGTAWISPGGGGGIITGSGTTNYVTKWTGTSAVGNSVMYDNGTNVGIGTTTPESLLHLSQASTGGDGAFLFIDNPASSTLGNTAGIRFATNAGASFSGYGSFIQAVNTNAGNGAESLTFGTWNGASRGERMRILDNGNVGIGTTIPASILQLGAGPSIPTNAAYNSFQAGSFGVLFRDNYDSYITFNTTYSPSGWLNKYNGLKSGVIQITDGRFSIDLGTGTVGGAASDLTERFVILNNGNVGIGTTSPGAKLHVFGNVGGGVGYNGGFYADTGSGSGIDTNWGFDFSKGGGDDYSTRVKFYPGAGSSRKLGFYDSRNNTWLGYFDGNANSNPNFVFSGSGNVGIESTSPIASLDNQGSYGTYRQRGLTTMVTNNLGAAGTQAKRFEIARASIDYNDWNTTGPIEVELYERYYSRGLKKKYVIYYGYVSSSGCNLVEMTGSGDNQFMVSIGPEVVISGDNRYIPIYVDVRYYSQVTAVVKTNRELTLTNPPGNGSIWMNNMPTGVDISDFTPDSTVYVGNIIGGNSVFTTGNVGIGTTNPIYALDINNTGASTARVRVLATTNYSLLQAQNSSGVLYLGIDDSSGGGFTSGAYSRLIWSSGAYPLIFATNDVERVRITSAGNVGINETAPSQKLHVSGNIRVTGAYYDSANSAGTSGQILSSTGTGTAWIAAPSGGGVSGSGTTNYITKWTSGSAVGNSVMYDNGTNVGIGTTSPGATLTVGTQSSGTDGSGVAQDNSIIARFGASNAGARVTGATIANTATATVGNDATLSFIVAGHYSATGLISAILKNTSVASTDMAFSVYDGGMYERMRITAGGNVGIGTTSPNAKLNVRGTEGSGSVSPQQDLVHVGGNELGGVGGYAGIRIGGASNTSYGAYIRGVKTTAYGNYWNTALTFSVTATNTETTVNEVMRITSDGNVGIGTTAPQVKTHIYTATDISLAYDEGQYGLWVSQTSTSKSLILGYSNTFNAGIINAVHSGVAWRNILIATNGGNVGIGTTAPGAKLQINDGTGSAEFLRLSVAYDTSRSARGGIYWHDTANTTGRIYTEYDGTMTSMVFGSLYNSGYNSNNLMIIRGNGNVGIGTTSPGYKLDVSGTIRATGDVIAYSDARVKENVETLDGALDKVMKMRGVSYNKIGEQEKKVGVIAQEILEVLPEVVSQDETGTYSVAYGNIVSVLIEAIKEQQKQIDELKAKLK